MNVLILGSGGREHAIAWKLSMSPLLNRLFIAPGNAGTIRYGSNVNVNPEDFPAVKELVLSNNIELVIVGPEAPLVAGISDFFLSDKDLSEVLIIGPGKSGALLEGSKDFAKQFMMKYNIPTARYESFTKDTFKKGREFLETLSPPYVLKADGLAAGKGVIILKDLIEAQNELEKMLNGKFGKASLKVVVEEFLDGIEMSAFVLTDGNDYVILPEAKDYKKIGEGDTGLNTGGMGAVSPVPFADNSFREKVEKTIIIPTIEGLKAEGIKYQGFIFFGLIKVKNDPYVIEYNVRLGDPETEVIVPRIKSDFLELLISASKGKLSESTIDIEARSCCAVMLVSGGYPDDYQKGKVITGIEKVSESLLFHAGTKLEGNNILTNGGRVIAISSYGDNIKEALAKSYQAAGEILYEGKYFRKDIGFDL